MDIIVFLISLIKQYTKLLFFFFFFNDTATTEIYTLSLHDALPISPPPWPPALWSWPLPGCPRSAGSAIQSPRSATPRRRLPTTPALRRPRGGRPPDNARRSRREISHPTTPAAPPPAPESGFPEKCRRAARSSWKSPAPAPLAVRRSAAA